MYYSCLGRELILIYFDQILQSAKKSVYALCFSIHGGLVEVSRELCVRGCFRQTVFCVFQDRRVFHLEMAEPFFGFLILFGKGTVFIKKTGQGITIDPDFIISFFL